MLHRHLAAAVLLALFATQARCADEDEQPRLSHEALEAGIVCFGWLENFKQGRDADPDTVELYIAKCFKGEKLLPEPRVITIHRHGVQHLFKNKTVSGIFFIKPDKKDFDVYRFEGGGLPLAHYMEGLLEIPKGDVDARIEYAFDHLDHPSAAVALAAGIELRQSPRADLSRFAKSPVPAARLRRPIRQKSWESDFVEQIPLTKLEYEKKLKQFEKDLEVEKEREKQGLEPRLLLGPIKPTPPKPGQPLLLGELAAKRGVPDAAVVRWREELESERRRPTANMHLLLLGMRGAPEDRPRIRAFVRQAWTDQRHKDLNAGLEAFARHTPADGLALMREVAESRDHSFPAAYEVCKVAKRLSEHVPEGMKETELDTVYVDLLNRLDLADLAVVDLAQAKNWRLTDKVLALHGKNDFDAPLIRRALIRYGLQCPLPAATEYVERMRKEAPERVKQVQEQLKDERR